MLKSFLVIAGIIGLLQLMCPDSLVIAVANQNLPQILTETDFTLHFPSQEKLPTPDQQRARLTENFQVEPRAGGNFRIGAFGGKLMTVCIGKSTLYNKPRVKDWLSRQIYEFQSPDDGTLALSDLQVRSRPLWFDLRLQLFLNGKSEECHIPQLNSWRPYLECALRRNQRMEYMIPKYPLHQVGYRFNWAVLVNETAYQSYHTYKARENWWMYWDN